MWSGWVRAQRRIFFVPRERMAARNDRAPAGLACGHARTARALRLTEDDAMMLAAMVAGDRTYLTHSLRVGFERTGSFHMLVVSGFHLAIVAGCIFWITRRLRHAARSGYAAHHRLPRLLTRSSPALPRRCSARFGW